MHKSVKPKERIRAISVGFKQRQLDFLDKYENINIHKLCRAALEEQIKLTDEDFLGEIRDIAGVAYSIDSGHTPATVKI